MIKFVVTQLGEVVFNIEIDIEIFFGRIDNLQKNPQSYFKLNVDRMTYIECGFFKTFDLHFARLYCISMKRR